MKYPFQKMKDTAREHYQRLRLIIRPDLGTHKRTRLMQAECDRSKSLLHDDVAERHAELLTDDFRHMVVPSVMRLEFGMAYPG